MKPFSISKATLNEFRQVYSYDPKFTSTPSPVVVNSQTCSSVSTKPWSKPEDPQAWTNHSWRRDQRSDDKSSFFREFSRYPSPGGPAYLSQSWKGKYDYVAGTVATSPDVRYGDVDRNALASALLLAVKQSSWNAATNLGEVKQTVNMIADSAYRIAYAYMSIKKALKTGFTGDGAAFRALRILRKASSRWKNPSAKEAKRLRRYKDAASIWLEIQYGWRPLLSDVYTAVKEIQRPKEYLNKVTVRRSYDQKLTAEYTSTNGTNGGTWVHRNFSDWHVGRAMTVAFSLDDDFGKHINSLGLTNPASLAWGLTPFSFVVDWLIPFEDWLNGFDATYGATFEKGVESVYVKRKERYLATCKSYTHPSWGGSGYGSAEATWDSEVYVRQLMFTWPQNNLYLKSPLSTSHAANALALLTQAFLGKRK